MDLNEVINPEFGLKTSGKWIGRKFGLGDKYTIIGWSGYTGKLFSKVYIIKCEVCALDQELFGEGLFRIAMSGINRNQEACGCNNKRRSTEKEANVLASRIANKYGYEFKRFKTPFKGVRTKCVLECSCHGEWDIIDLDRLKQELSISCPECSFENRRIPEQERIDQILSTGSYPEGTIFKRDDISYRRDYWFVSCPDCEETNRTRLEALLLGQFPCSCSKHKQVYAYVYQVMDEGLPIAIKFGISVNYETRLKEQLRNNFFEIKRLGIWKFEFSQSCRLAERVCKNTLECGVLSKNDLPDGYTETTYLHNLDKIIEIYEEYGGIRIE